MNTEQHGTDLTKGSLRQRLARTDGELLHRDVTGAILHAAHAVHNALGCGLLEKVYENALALELSLDARQVKQQAEFPVIFRQNNIGTYYADLIVDGKVIVEVKAVESLDNIHRAQLMNYLRISGLRVGLLINFAKTKIEFERIVV